MDGMVLDLGLGQPVAVEQRTDDKVVDVRHGRHLASNIPGARYIEIPGIEHYPWFSNDPGVLDEIQEFITGVRPVPEIDRVLCTVLFTDIVRSTELASSLGDARWRDLLEQHHTIVRKVLDRFRGREVTASSRRSMVLRAR